MGAVCVVPFPAAVAGGSLRVCVCVCVPRMLRRPPGAAGGRGGDVAVCKAGPAQAPLAGLGRAFAELRKQARTIKVCSSLRVFRNTEMTTNYVKDVLFFFTA